jgi:hypothetical protein
MERSPFRPYGAWNFKVVLGLENLCTRDVEIMLRV